jgi:dipeptidyl-peptidase-4
MQLKHRTPGLFILIAAFAFAATWPVSIPAQQAPKTVAEATNYDATSRYADVMAFIRDLQRLSPLVRVETLCVSAEGREVPLLIVGKPVPSSPAALRSDPRIVVYVQANIHAGEVEGKEASLMLVRDIVLDPAAPWLDKLVLVVAPVFNADGNEKISPENRSDQPGPKQGVGVRPNGRNLDLNRDSMKLESPELRGMVRGVLERWDPLVVVDCHTTDGAYHEETVTWSWPVNPNGDIPLLEFQRQNMFPAINAIMKDKYRTPALGYGMFKDFRAPEKGWATFEPQPRFVTNYVGLRNRISLLDENYVHADFKTRVAGNYAFLKAVFDFSAGQAGEIRRLTAEADRKAVARGLAPKDSDGFGIDFDLLALPEPITVHSYEMEIVERPGTWPEIKKTDRTKTWTIPYFADYRVKTAVRFPFAYLLPGTEAEAAAKLLEHGIAVERLEEPARLEVQTFKPKEIKSAERLYQGHHLNTLRGDYVAESLEFPAGTILVRTAQPLGTLAAYLLEPESDDGLAVWNFFDRDIVPQWGRGFEPYPVRKLLKPAPLVTRAMGS